jgi:hypothetical protein
LSIHGSTTKKVVPTLDLEKHGDDRTGGGGAQLVYMYLDRSAQGRREKEKKGAS